MIRRGGQQHNAAAKSISWLLLLIYLLLPPHLPLLSLCLCGFTMRLEVMDLELFPSCKQLRWE